MGAKDLGVYAVGAGRIAQLAVCLLCMPKDRSSILSTHISQAQQCVLGIPGCSGFISTDVIKMSQQKAT